MTRQLAGHTSVEMTDIDALPLVESKRLVTTGGHFAYLRLQKGVINTVHIVSFPKSAETLEVFLSNDF